MTILFSRISYMSMRNTTNAHAPLPYLQHLPDIRHNETPFVLDIQRHAFMLCNLYKLVLFWVSGIYNAKRGTHHASP